jgi:hypothetical protein
MHRNGGLTGPPQSGGTNQSTYDTSRDLLLVPVAY